ncbi:DUF1707 SHOCT-like domain-containing protein [Actinokineospora bangkokensis]|uniref:DUF1707 SHOCT-like domain-containing protein n=1 Tax=Actinokineospora bangkokensis TaxID=1193682 RepID=UPI001E5D598E|nr:DUF1707 domain-containing protein [Actinokineospora bangkokensis]
MTEPISPRDLRVSDAERSHVVGVLQKATGRGLLSLDEFTERTDRALAARTRGELNVLLVDLPGLVNAENAPAPSAPLELRARMSSVRREGAWEVPAELRLTTYAGSIDLDFTEAVLLSPTTHVHVDVKAANVTLLLPDNSPCDLRDVESSVGGRITDRGIKVPTADGPRFRLTGTVRAGSLTIHRPTYARFGPLTLRKPWKVTWNG